MPIGKVMRFVRKEITNKSLSENEEVVSTIRTFRQLSIRFDDGSEFPYSIKTEREDKDYEGLLGQSVHASIVMHRDGNFISRIEVGEDDEKETEGRRTGKTERKRQNRMNKQPQA